MCFAINAIAVGRIRWCVSSYAGKLFEKIACIYSKGEFETKKQQYEALMNVVVEGRVLIS